MPGTLIFLLVVLPVLSAAALAVIGRESPRRRLAIVTCAVTAAAGLFLFAYGNFEYSPPALFEAAAADLIAGLNFALLGLILVIAVRLQSPRLIVATLAAIVLLVCFEFLLSRPIPAGPALAAGDISRVALALVTLAALTACARALGLIRGHPARHAAQRGGQPAFFSLMLLFLGSINGLIVSESPHFFLFFWNLTAVCVFALIDRDGGSSARRSAEHVFLIQLLGASALTLSMIACRMFFGAWLIDAALARPGAALALPRLAPVFPLCLAALILAAQPPFQSWLTRAAAATAPVSILMHACAAPVGACLILRLAPAFAATAYGSLIALFGAFSFLAASALALGRRDVGEIFACSTTASLGLIVCCAGVNTPATIRAGVVLLVCHCAGKTLLFLCLDGLPRRLGADFVRAPRGLRAVKAGTAVAAVIGVLTMLSPPLALIFADGGILEAALSWPLDVALLVSGGAVSAFLWTRFAVLILTAPVTGVAAAGAEAELALRLTGLDRPGPQAAISSVPTLHADGQAGLSRWINTIAMTMLAVMLGVVL